MTIQPRPLCPEAKQLFGLAREVDSPGPGEIRRLDERLADLLLSAQFIGASSGEGGAFGGPASSARPRGVTKPVPRGLTRWLAAGGSVASLGMLLGAFWLGRATSPQGTESEVDRVQTSTALEGEMSASLSVHSGLPGPYLVSLSSGKSVNAPGLEHRPAPTTSVAVDVVAGSNLGSAAVPARTDDIVLLSEAERALREGRPDWALSRLSQVRGHDLQQQVGALRALAWCQQGSLTVGRAQARRVLAHWPRSVFGPRLNRDCDL